MGFWRRLFGLEEAEKPKPKRNRGPSRPAAERLKAEEARYLSQLSKTDPAAYNELMRKRLGLTGAEAKDDLEQLEKQITRLRRMGIIKSPNDIGEGNAGLIKEAIQGLAMFAPMLGGMRMQLPVAGETPALPAATQPAPVPVQPPLQPTVAPGTGEDIRAPQTEEGAMHAISQYLIAQLDGKSPEAAAEWLTKQSYPQARELVAALCQTQDGQLMALLAQIADASPEARGLVNWLRLNEVWFYKTVRELRRITGSAAPGSGQLSI